MKDRIRRLLDPEYVWFQSLNSKVFAQATIVSNQYRWQVFNLNQDSSKPVAEGREDTCPKAMAKVFDFFKGVAC